MIVRADRIPLPTNDYPTSDGKPMAETDHHRRLMLALIETLDGWFAADPMVYVSGNLLVFYEKGDKKRHVAPDVFVVRGVPKALRPNYLVWEEKTPDVVIELTSKTTKAEDTKTKRALYEGTLKVKEYFLFDPLQDYLKPSFQGFRRVRGRFKPIDPAENRLPSEVLSLHLERDGDALRLWNPATGERLPTLAEQLQRADSAQEATDRAIRAAEIAKDAAELARQAAEEARDRVFQEVAQLRRELDTLRRKHGNGT